MIYRIDFLNHVGKPMIKIFKIKYQAEEFVAYLAKHGYDSVITSWDRPEIKKYSKKVELKQCLGEVKHD